MYFNDSENHVVSGAFLTTVHPGLLPIPGCETCNLTAIHG